mmetsp:Transcript_15232/g.47201  ORF Transcript_15232/g.47201 Transcript_15232/m.47201 type:complete len:276 (-) Transcript_15232:477-1304(-)
MHVCAKPSNFCVIHPACVAFLRITCSSTAWLKFVRLCGDASQRCTALLRGLVELGERRHLRNVVRTVAQQLVQWMKHAAQCLLKAFDAPGCLGRHQEGAGLRNDKRSPDQHGRDLLAAACWRRGRLDCAFAHGGRVRLHHFRSAGVAHDAGAQVAESAGYDPTEVRGVSRRSVLNWFGLHGGCGSQIGAEAVRRVRAPVAVHGHVDLHEYQRARVRQTFQRNVDAVSDGEMAEDSEVEISDVECRGRSKIERRADGVSRGDKDISGNRGDGQDCT